MASMMDLMSGNYNGLAQRIIDNAENTPNANPQLLAEELARRLQNRLTPVSVGDSRQVARLIEQTTQELGIVPDPQRATFLKAQKTAFDVYDMLCSLEIIGNKKAWKK